MSESRRSDQTPGARKSNPQSTAGEGDATSAETLSDLEENEVLSTPATERVDSSSENRPSPDGTLEPTSTGKDEAGPM